MRGKCDTDAESAGGTGCRCGSRTGFSPGGSPAVHSFHFVFGNNHRSAGNRTGHLQKSKNVTTNLSANVRVNYNRVFAGKHDLTVGANMDYYLTLLDNVGITGYGVGTINSSSAINQSLSGNRKPAVSGLKDKSAQLGFGGSSDIRSTVRTTCMRRTRRMLLPSCRPTSAGTVPGQ